MDTANIEVQMPVESIVQTKKPRVYSFRHKNIEKLNTVEVYGKEIPIPASLGSTYWAILKTCYQYADKPVTMEQLCLGVEELMIDRDKEAWEKYIVKNMEINCLDQNKPNS